MPVQVIVGILLEDAICSSQDDVDKSVRLEDATR